ncbi:MAG: hypothetical protein WKF78_13325 [Candidatus Limnocylindrales bacterium]
MSGRQLGTRLVQADLFRPDTDVDRRADRRIADERAGRSDAGAVRQPNGGVRRIGSFKDAGQQVADTQEARHEARHRALVEALRVAQLLVMALVHDGDPIRHRHRLLLVVGHVDERDPDLLLDAFEFALHLLAQLQVKGAQGLVQE